MVTWVCSKRHKSKPFVQITKWLLFHYNFVFSCSASWHFICSTAYPTLCQDLSSLSKGFCTHFNIKCSPLSPTVLSVLTTLSAIFRKNINLLEQLGWTDWGGSSWVYAVCNSLAFLPGQSYKCMLYDFSPSFLNAWLQWNVLPIASCFRFFSSTHPPFQGYSATSARGNVFSTNIHYLAATNAW